MSYLSLLEQARRRLESGAFWEAEQLLEQASQQWRASRFRAPLLERGLEPALRWGRRLLRGRDEGPVLQTFPELADRLEKDLASAAELWRVRVGQIAQAGSDVQDRGQRERLARALELDRSTKRFRLSGELRWPVVRAYLEHCRVQGCSPNPALLPNRAQAGAEDAEWLAEWCAELLHAGDETTLRLLRWILPVLSEPIAGVTGPLHGRLLALACRAALLGERDGSRALSLGRRALESELEREERASLLRVIGSLVCNEHVLAVTGANAWRDLEQLGLLAAEIGRPWPPAELRELLLRRRPDSSAEWATVSWDAEQCLVLIRHQRCVPCDVLVLRPQDEADETVPFTCSWTQARAAIDRWLAEGALLLCEREPDSAVRALLGKRPCLPLMELAEALPRPRRAEPVRADASASHPLLLESVGNVADSAQTWVALVDRARGLVPQAQRCLDSTAFCSPWGRANLEALGRAGLELCAALGLAVEQLGLTDFESISDEDMQEVPGSVGLRWPRLALRPWPAGSARAQIPEFVAEGDLLVLQRADLPTLAGWVLHAAPCRLTVADEARALEVAEACASAADPTRITASPRYLNCPEPLLHRLDLWVEEGLVEPARQFDVLWLYQALANSPDGDIGRWLRGGRSEARRELADVLRTGLISCEPDCRLAPGPGGCFAEQLMERSRRAAIWIESDGAQQSPPHLDVILVDDLVEWVGAIPAETELGAALEAELSRWAGAQRVIVWANGAALRNVLRSRLEPWLGPGRTLRVGGSGPGRELQLDVVPPGYAPDAALVREEAWALLGERLRACARRAPGGRIWWADESQARALGLELDGLPSAVQSWTSRPLCSEVVVPLLGGLLEIGPLVAALRLAAAGTHASVRLTCLDPRLPAILPELSANGGAASALASRPELDPGVELLERLPARRIPAWADPLNQERLGRVARVWGLELAGTGGARLGALAEALSSVRAGSRRVLAGASLLERTLVARALQQLAWETRDGGPLRVRCVIWVSTSALRTPSQIPVGELHLGETDEASLDGALLAVDQGDIQLLALHPRLLAQTSLQRWARQSRQIAWLLVETERFDPRHPLGCPHELQSLTALARATREADAMLLAAVDDPDAASDDPASRMAILLDASIHQLPRKRSLDELWRWRRVLLTDPQTICVRCGGRHSLSHPHALCSDCGQALLPSPIDPRRSEALLRRQTELWLAAQGPHAQWLLIAQSEDDAHHLRRALGLESADGSEIPLLASRSDRESFHQEVLLGSSLWERNPRPRDLLLNRIPMDWSWLKAVLMRLLALGWQGGRVQVLDHPLRWSMEGWVPGVEIPELERRLHTERMRWNAPRTEIEFRLRDALSRLRREQLRRLRAPAKSEFGWGTGGERDLPPADRTLLGLLESQPPPALPGELLRATAEEFTGRIDAAFKSIERSFAALDGLDWSVGREGALAPLAPQRIRQAGGEELRWLLLWMLHEQLMTTAVPVNASDAPAPDQRVQSWLRRARAIAPKQDSSLPLGDQDREQSQSAPNTPRNAAVLRPGRTHLGIAGSGKSSSLVEIALEAASRREPVLVVVPSGGGVLGWQSMLEQRLNSAPKIEVAKVHELGLALLRDIRVRGPVVREPRLLPAAMTADGEEIRARLLSRISRGYALEAGTVPALESAELRRILEGDELLARVAAAGAAVDVQLLERCIREARDEEGWVGPGELFRVLRSSGSREPAAALQWGERYPTVVVDDLHALSADALSLVDMLFSAEARFSTADPLLLEGTAPNAATDADYESLRLGRELVRAVEDLYRDQPAWPAELRGRRGRERGRVLRQKVVNLEACVDLLLQWARDSRGATQRRAIVIAHQGDRRHLAGRLREHELEIWVADAVFRVAAPGPRELLAVLLLLVDCGLELDASVRADLLRVLLRQSPGAGQFADPLWLAARLQSWMDGEPIEPIDAHEAYVASLAELAPRLSPDHPLTLMIELLERSSVLAGTWASDVARGRLRDFVRDGQWSRTADLLRLIDPVAVARPLASGSHVWLLGPDDLLGLEFDHIAHVCTGYEPPPRHYQVAGHCAGTLHVFFADRDPFGPQR